MAISGKGPDISAVFFDLGDTLGTATVGGSPIHLIRFDVFPFILPSSSNAAERGVLERLKKRGLRLGVISNTGDDKAPAMHAVLAPTGLLAHLDPALLVYSGDEGVTKASPQIFNNAAARAGLMAEACLFVGENAAERAVAKSAGWRICPHPLMVDEVLDGESLRFVRLEVPGAYASQTWQQAVRVQAFVPMHVSGPRGTIVYGLASQRAALSLMNMQFRVDLLGEPDGPLTNDLYLLRDDLGRESGFGSSVGAVASMFSAPGKERMLVSSMAGSAVVSLPSDSGPESLHFAKTRHGHNLKLVPDPLFWDAPFKADGQSIEISRALPTRVIAPATVSELNRIDATTIAHAVERYSGARSLDGTANGLSISSRHVKNPGNAQAVGQLVADFLAVGFEPDRVQLHQFSLLGQTLHNVEAELPGSSAELVIVTAHLDSTAGADDEFEASMSPAPGADDDASGMAAVLAIAERCAALAKDAFPKRTLRFVLFNAEEQGLVGSQAYARRAKARGESIAAVFQMDMIGYNATPPQNWEVHAGFEQSHDVEARSRALADLLSAVAAQVSPTLPAAQIHHSTSLGGDPAAGRSDHASFQAHGYAACVVSEDFFMDGPSSGSPDANPNYHSARDTNIDAVYTADLARVVAAAACYLAWEMQAATSAFAKAPLPPRQCPSVAQHPSLSRLAEETKMTMPREFDCRKRATKALAPPSVSGAAPKLVKARENALTRSPAIVAAAEIGQDSTNKSLIDRALDFVQRQPAAFGMTAGQTAEYVPDTAVQRTSAGAAAINLKQTYRGIPVFQMSRMVRFDPQGQIVDAAGDTASIPAGVPTEPRVSAAEAVLKAAQHIASTGQGHTHNDQFKRSHVTPAIDVSKYVPEVVAGFPLSERPTVLSKGPFENLISAHLLIFNQPDRVRLAWHIVLTLPDYVDQFVVIVSADEPKAEILYSKSTVQRVKARGRVYEFSPKIADRRLVDFPRPLSDYPAMATMPLVAFPPDWVDGDRTLGNSTRATLNFTTNSLTGVVQNGVIVFEPNNATGDDQKLLNIFYFCNYMHDFLHILGFDEASGNFQRINFTSNGAAGDPVRARAHSGEVFGTANMSTGPDGLPPLMNMGLVGPPVNRHTAFDADVVFHEYVHGLTIRLVGGRIDPNALDKLQSGGMGEGWGDYFALTVQNFFLDQEKVVTGDWVVDNPGGIRRAPYDANYPFDYGQLRNFPEVHDIGEVWCATLMQMTRNMIVALNCKKQGYRIAWQIVVDGLKMTPPNPTFLDARDAILGALDDLAEMNKINQITFETVRRSAWESFAKFGMGAAASSGDADDLDGIVADFTVPQGV